MSLHSYSKILLHIIWGTLNRENLVTKALKPQIEKYISNCCKELDVYLIEIYANPDYIHILVDFPTTITVEDFIKRIKGSSSHYVNKEKLIKTRFGWGRGYGVFSVSQSNRERTVDYIRNQEEHHRIKSFAEEVEQFLEKYGVTKKPKGL